MDQQQLPQKKKAKRMEHSSSEHNHNEHYAERC
jgi:hypothetical protein